MTKLLCFLVLLCASAGIKAQQNPKKAKEDNTVYTAVEIQPEFPGGEAAMAKFLQKNLHLPKISETDQISGKIVMQWIVEKDGSITHIDILKSAPAFKESIIKMLKLMPGWSPGLLNGKPVRVQFTCPLNIELGDF